MLQYIAMLVGGKGPEVFAFRPNIRADNLAKDIYYELLKVYYNKANGRGVKYSKEIRELRETTAPAVDVEVGFHDNEADAEWILNNTNVIAQAIANGINNYFKS